VDSVLADATLLYRCFVVWGRDLKIIAFPVVLFIASVVCGYLFEGSSSIEMVFGRSWIYVILTFSLNVILTGLTGEFVSIIIDKP
jgi:hypothetical protein